MPIAHLVVVVETVALIVAAPICANAQQKSHVTSEQVTHAIQELEKLAQKQVQENALPGLAIAIVFQDKAVHAKGFGVRDVNTKAPVDADTVFQLASLSKPIWLNSGRRVSWCIQHPQENDIRHEAPWSRQVQL